MSLLEIKTEYPEKLDEFMKTKEEIIKKNILDFYKIWILTKKTFLVFVIYSNFLSEQNIKKII